MISSFEISQHIFSSENGVETMFSDSYFTIYKDNQKYIITMCYVTEYLENHNAIVIKAMKGKDKIPTNEDTLNNQETKLLISSEESEEITNSDVNQQVQVMLNKLNKYLLKKQKVGKISYDQENVCIFLEEVE